MEQDINFYLNKLSYSKFRSSFHLKPTDKEYINKKSIKTIKSHAYDFITKRLAPAEILNDGKQTPMRGHPVFVAQHATATCCRGCFEKWYKIQKGKQLSNEEIDFAVNLIMGWIEKEISQN